ncbi:hypothetical protein AB0J63_26875 [Streptosporangium canum]|uniref:hypothetical protein n=1 Tax=Streptosporangium canum TaxID=324952 RepID=UPI00343D72BE
MSPDSAPTHARLDAAMNKRREALHMTWANVATDAKITVETLRAIRRGHNQPSALTKRGIENALQWEPGSVDHILDGEEPTPVAQEIAAPTPAAEAKAPAAEPAILEIKDPTPTETALLAYLAAMQQELTNVNAKLEEQNAKVEEQGAKLDELLERRQRKGA